MNEERRKVLEMLSEGKITIDAAERLLAALEPDPAPPSETGPARSRPIPGEPEVVDLDDLENRIRAGVDSARRTVQASMPRLRAVIRDAAPDVERIVQEATASIPRIVEDMTRSIRDAFGSAPPGDGDDERFPARAEREFTEEASLGEATLLELSNPRGRIDVETWDEDRLRAEVSVRVRGVDADSARRCADGVGLSLEPDAECLRLRPVFAEGRHQASYELAIRLHLPARLRLDLRTSHGDLVVPEMGADVILGGDHGEIRLARTAGAAKVQHDHGSVHVGRVGGDFVLNSHHSHLNLDEAVGAAHVNSHHGRLAVRRVGGRLVVNAHHSPLDVDEVHGDTVANNHHGPIRIGRVLKGLTINCHHNHVDVAQVGGDLHLSSSHGPVLVDEVHGEVSARNSHAPLDIGAVGQGAVVRSSHGPVSLGPVGQEVTVEADWSDVAIGAAGGRVTVRADRSRVTVHRPTAEVLVENNRAPIAILPEGPVSSAYTLSNSRGNVQVVLPEGSDVEVHGFVRRGRVESDLPLAVVANGEQGQTVDGTLGRGGPAVRVEVDRGNLSLVSGGSGAGAETDEAVAVAGEASGPEGPAQEGR